MTDRRWAKLKDVDLYPWQQEATDAWHIAKKGTIKVVTGVGKTMCALAIIDRLQQEVAELRIAVVVPSTVLLDQWQEEFKNRFGVPDEFIGILGAGRNDFFNDSVRILICVINSAAKKLPTLVGEELGRNLLLIVDECHRAGAPTFNKVFNTRRAYSLGLSATPERGGVDLPYDASSVGRELGPIIYEMNYAEAGKQGLLPEFEVLHFALPLNNGERQEYIKISKQIFELRRKLMTKFRRRDKKIFHSWVQKQAKLENSETGRWAQGYLGAALMRKQLLYKAEARDKAVRKLLEHIFQENPQAKIIMFHETIEQVEDIHRRLVAEGYSAAIEHSGLTKSRRQENIDEFKRGNVQIIVSARTLIEGFNVPQADVGIVVASSSSVRQRIQTLGRVLRRGEKGKEAVVYILYMHDTTDENVYQKADWDDLVGPDRNSYFYWDGENPPKIIADPAPGVWGAPSVVDEDQGNRGISAPDPSLLPSPQVSEAEYISEL